MKLIIDNTTILITGASSGIGESLINSFLSPSSDGLSSFLRKGLNERAYLLKTKRD
jgi:FlaA1/EpsC-like NDP-sugar epimerase